MNSCKKHRQISQELIRLHFSPSPTPVYETIDWAGGHTTDALSQNKRTPVSSKNTRSRGCLSLPAFHWTGVSHALLLFPCFMTLHEHGFDGGSVTARAQVPIPNAPGKIHRCIVVSMGLEPAHLAAERPLIRSVCAVRVMAHAALLRTVRTDDRGGLHPTFLTIPSDLLRNMS